jgi:hypothetical protein
MSSSGAAAAASFFLSTTPAVANRVFLPQLPSLHTNFQEEATQLLHLKVGLLNVAWQSTGSGSTPQRPTATSQPPMTQPLTLPLLLHLHPTLLAATYTRAEDSHATGDQLDGFVPPTLQQLHSSLLPSLLHHLPSMISSIKTKKLSTLRGNRVGLLRDARFVATFTFKETEPAYHVLTVSSKRVRQLDAQERQREREKRLSASTSSSGKAGAASAAPPKRPGYSLSSHLTNFDLFSSPDTPIHLLPIRRSTGLATSPADESEGEGFYLGEGYASYLVSKHTLHVRIMPKKKWVEQMAEECRAERKRRERLAQMERKLASGLEEEAMETEDSAAAVSDAITNKRKRPVDSSDSTRSKRRSAQSDAAMRQLSEAAPIVPDEDDFELSGEEQAQVEVAPSDEALQEQEGDEAAAWLNYQV